MDDLYDYAARLELAYSVLERAEHVSRQDKENVRRFVEQLKALGVSTGRQAKYVFHLKVALECLGIGAKAVKRNDIERLMVSLRSKGYSSNTLKDYIVVIKRFYKWLRAGNLDRDTPFPKEVRWLSEGVKLSQSTKPEFFTPAEVEAMIKAADNVRDRAMLAVGFEGGLRASELLGMHVGDVSFDQMGARARIRGKTGERIVRLISGAPLLTKHLETHKWRDEPERPLWTSYARNYEGQGLKWSGWSRRLKQLAGKAGVNGKRIHSHLLRHGSATQAARFLSDSELKVRYGWAPGSRSPAIYVHLSGADLDDKLARIYSGKTVKPPEPEFRPVVCPRCKRQSTPGERFCNNCGCPLDMKELMKSSVEVEELKSEIGELRRMLQTVLSQSVRGGITSSPSPSV